MNKEFISCKQAIALKELGFNEECLAGYNKDTNQLYISYEDGEPTFNQEYYVLAPLYQQAFRFFRDKHKLILKQQRDGGWWIFEVYDISDEDDCSPTQVGDSILKDTYEEAESACLDKLIKIIKTQKSNK